jgi:HAD superfamily hydrolase (TIGR01509 family)
LLKTSGGLERLLRDLAERDDAPWSAGERLALARELHRRKNAAYARRVAGDAIALRPGVLRLMQQAQAHGARLAMATTTGRANVDALLSRQLGVAWLDRFDAVVCAEDAPLKKPHPQVYHVALQHLGLHAGEALAIEDSPQGLASARAAGIEVLLTRSAYFADCCGDGAIAICDGLDSAVSARGIPDAAQVHWPWLCDLHRRTLHTTRTTNPQSAY